MTSRERILAALTGSRLPDRVPISTYELCGRDSRAFENNQPSYRRLMEKIRCDTDSLTMWNNASDEKALLTAHAVQRRRETVREGDRTTSHDTFVTPKGELCCTQVTIDGIHTIWNTEHLCKSTDDVDKLLSIPYEPLTYDDSDFARISAETGEHGVIMASLADPLCYAMEMMEFGEATVWALTETEHFARTVDALHERVMRNLENSLSTRTVDVYRICGAEYATPPYLPPRFFERFVEPYEREMTELIHRHGGLVRVHSHGRIGQVLDSILRIGADGLDPCETPPDGDIALGELRKRTEGRLCLFGSMQLKALEHASPDEIRAMVQGFMEAAKAGGRYVIMPTAAPINLPLSPQTEENYFVFIDTALQLGAY